MATVVVGEFEWHADKAQANLAKHGISFDEAVRAFEDPFGLELADLTHPERFTLIGMTYPERLLFVVYTEMTSSGRIRIISARKATRHEQETYANR